MKKTAFTAALLAALMLTACGGTAEEESKAETTTTTTAAVSTAEESSAAEEESEAEDPKAEEESSAAEESKAEEKQTEPPEESKPDVTETTRDKTDPPPSAGSNVVDMQGTGYTYKVDLSKWVNTIDNFTMTQIDNGQSGFDPSIEYIYGWLGDKKSTCVMSASTTPTDTTGYDMNVLGEMYAERDGLPEGQQLISWNVQEINGLEWIRLEYSLDASLMGFTARSLVYMNFSGIKQTTINFSMPEESIEDIDKDLTELMWSVEIQ